MSKQDEYVSLHTHSECSAYDGLGHVSEFFEKAAEMGQSALALSEHGSIRNLHEAAAAAEATGVKLIPAVEAYCVDDATVRGLTDEEKADLKNKYPNDDEYKVHTKRLGKERKSRFHLSVWATNQVGLQNLLKLTWWSWSKGFYYRNRIDLNILEQYQEGLAVSTGCVGGVVCSPLRQGDYKTAIQRATRLAEVFGDRFVVELMPHVPEPDCVPLASQLVKIANRYGSMLVATQDAHYPNEGDSNAQDGLLCIHNKDRISDPSRFKFDSNQYWLKSRAELAHAFARDTPWLPKATVDLALDNTVRFAERCTAKIEKVKAGKYLAAPALPEGIRDYDEWLALLCREGAAARRLAPLSEAYRTRLDYELGVIRGLGFAAYFCMVWDMRKWAREQDIMVGPGRGSASGAITMYLIRATEIDPIRHGLSFERFLAEGRVDWPDYDGDVEHERRDELVGYLRQKYGEDHVAHISTHNTLGGKATLNDLARVYSIPHKEVEAVSALIHVPTEEEERHDDSLSRVLKGTATGREWAKRYPDAAEVAGRLEGQLRSVGMHAAGIVISSHPLVDLVPMETRKRGNERVAATAYDMYGVETAGLVKMDVLGLKTLTMLKRVFKATGTKPEDIDLEDPEVLAGFTDGRFGEIFQYDTPSSRRLCRGFVFKRFADVAVMTSLNRPGPARSGMASLYIDRAADPSLVPSIHPIYDRVFETTFGVMCFQEQVILLVKELCGYSSAAADKFRKKVAKKIGLSDEHEVFVNGAVDVGGMERPAAEKLFANLIGFAAYAFSLNHAAAYSVLSVWSMALKLRFPAAFYASALDMAGEKADATSQLRLASEAKQLGIAVRPPSVNATSTGFQVIDGEVVGSIGSIKGIGTSTAQAIADNAPYASLIDFKKRTAGHRVTAKTFEVLAKATALRHLTANSTFLAKNAATVWKMLGKGLEPVLEGPCAAPGDEVAMAAEVWPLYATVEGHTAFSMAEAEARKSTRQPLFSPGEAEVQEQGGHLVFARTAGLKLFANDRGERSGRAILVSAEGAEQPVKVDGDVLESTADLLRQDGRHCIALLWGTGLGGVSVEAVWPYPVETPIGQWVLSPSKTAPRDPARTLARTEEDETFAAEGLVVRVRHHLDKNRGKMLTVGLMGQASYVRFFVFASRAASRDVSAIKPGARISLRLKALKGGAACLTDRPIQVVKAEPSQDVHSG